ncbi:MAG: glycosyltransferase family 4 protein [Blastocatellia bacterium]
MSTVKVCHLCASTLDTSYFTSLSKGLDAKGIRTLWGSVSDQPPPSWVSRLQHSSGYFSLGAASRLHYPAAVRQLARILKCERPDFVQTHLVYGGLIGALASKLTGVPLILTRHHMDDVWLGGTRFHVELDRWMARQASVVVVPSQAVYEHLYTREKLDNVRMEVIHYGFDFQAFDVEGSQAALLRSELGLDGAFIIGCIARLVKNKGQQFLIESLSQLVNKIPEVKLLLLGGGDTNQLQALAQSCGVAERVVFAGHRSDVAACMKAMDVIVHPSLSEAFCQVIIEGMGVGTAMIATNVGGSKEVITDGKNGLLIPHSDPGAITGAVLKLYEDSAWRQRLAREGQLTVRRRFTVERMVGAQVDLYQRYSQWRKAA